MVTYVRNRRVQETQHQGPVAYSKQYDPLSPKPLNPNIRGLYGCNRVWGSS